MRKAKPNELINLKYFKTNMLILTGENAGIIERMAEWVCGLGGGGGKEGPASEMFKTIAMSQRHRCLGFVPSTFLTLRDGPFK